MQQAARLTDSTAHGAPLSPGPGSANVHIGGRPAWRALPAGPLQASVEAAAAATGAVISAALLTPPAAAATIVQLQASIHKTGADAAAHGNSGAAVAATSAAAGLAATNATLTAAWIVAAAAPGGEPAASQAYTRALQTAVASATGAVFTSVGGMTDLHQCPAPSAAGPHGPGLVTRGSETVTVNGLPAVRRSDKLIEACGGEDAIAAGWPTVLIGA